MENNEVMVTEVMDVPEVVETNGNGVVGFVVGAIFGAVSFGVGKIAKTKIKDIIAKRKEAKEEVTTDITEEIEVDK